TRAKRIYSDIGSEWIVQSEGAIEFKLTGSADFDLGPSSHGIQRLQLRIGIWISAEQHAAANSPAQPSNRPATIKLATKAESRRERNAPVCHACPAVNTVIESPILTTVIAC